MIANNAASERPRRREPVFCVECGGAIDGGRYCDDCLLAKALPGVPWPKETTNHKQVPPAAENTPPHESAQVLAESAASEKKTAAADPEAAVPRVSEDTSPPRTIFLMDNTDGFTLPDATAFLQDIIWPMLQGQGVHIEMQEMRHSIRVIIEKPADLAALATGKRVTQ